MDVATLDVEVAACCELAWIWEDDGCCAGWDDTVSVLDCVVLEAWLAVLSWPFGSDFDGLLVGRCEGVPESGQPGSAQASTEQQPVKPFDAQV